MDSENNCQSNPHDPIAVITLYDESFSTFETGILSIGSSHGLDGMTLFKKDDTASARVAVTVKPNIIEEIIKRIIK